MRTILKGSTFLIIIINLIACSRQANQPEGPVISPYLFGQNMWLTDGAEGRTGYIEKNLFPMVKESGVKIIRIGGNAFEHHMPSFEQLEGWVKAIRETGAEPMIQVSSLEPAEKAAACVRYFNQEKNYKLKFWSIGNEPFIIAHRSIDSISAYIKSHSSAMKQVDPTIKILIPDEAAYSSELYKALLLDDRKGVAGRDPFGNWYIDGVNFHNYPNSKQYTRNDVIFFSVSKMRGMILDLLEDVRKANLKYDRRGEDKLLWGITEFNITYDNPDDISPAGFAVPSFINGQYWADVFALGMEFGAFCITPWCIQESDRPATYFGYIGGPPDFLPNPTYYHMQMMSAHMRGHYLKLKAGDPFVKIHGSYDGETTSLLFMNQHETRSFNIDLAAANKPDDQINDVLAVTSKTPLRLDYKGKLEPSSSLMLIFDKRGKCITGLFYNQSMAIEHKAPGKIN
ncbi:MAG: hypothetical protein U0T82_06235 [Bacteroidales bacterium]